MGGRAKPQTWLRPLPDELVDELVKMAMLAPGDAKARIRELVRLVEAELQGQLAQHEYYVRRRDASVT